MAKDDVIRFRTTEAFKKALMDYVAAQKKIDGPDNTLSALAENAVRIYCAKEIVSRAEAHGFKSVKDYLHALHEMDLHYAAHPALHPIKVNRVLRITPQIEGKPIGVGAGNRPR